VVGRFGEFVSGALPDPGLFLRGWLRVLRFLATLLHILNRCGAGRDGAGWPSNGEPASERRRGLSVFHFFLGWLPPVLTSAFSDPWLLFLPIPWFFFFFQSTMYACFNWRSWTSRLLGVCTCLLESFIFQFLRCALLFLL